MSDRCNKWRVAGVCLLLGLVTLGVYLPVLHHGFITYDDSVYLTDNPHVNHGLTWDGLKWAFTSIHGEATYWHPLTWISHMVDCQLFGLKPGPQHLVNVFFHMANAILLFLLLRTMTNAFWRSAVVAMLFAWHPLQVDTVAWAAERKNVLSTLFGLLALGAYVRYTHGSVGRILPPQAGQSLLVTALRPMTSRSYWLALVYFALGLMCKPVLVTLPFVLMLLDIWPLNRFQLSRHHFRFSTLRTWVRDKWLFFALSVASSVITIVAHLDLGSIMESGYGLPLNLRIENALVSYVRYLGKAFWPVNLAICYPHPGVWPAEDVFGSLAILVTVTTLAAWKMRRRPYLLVGWLWFLGVLVPMIGVIQAGVQAMADRFAYVPLIGLFIAVVWGVSDFAHQARLPKLVLPLAVTGVLLGCILRTSSQLCYWKDGVTLFTHAIDVTENNFTAHTVLGLALSTNGKTNEATAQFAEAIRINPQCADALNDMGVLLTRQGEFEKARSYLDAAARIKPQFANVIEHLALELAAGGNTEQVTSYLRDALRWKPKDAEMMNNLAWILATTPDSRFRDGAEAVRLAERACELTHYKTAIMVGTLAAAYADSGRFEDAVTTAQRAAALAKAAGNDDLSETNLRLAKLFRSGQRFLETTKSTNATPSRGTVK